jgi:hypothetical protein
VVTWSSPSYQPNCAGCHASRYKSDPHMKIQSTNTRYTVSELRNCAGSCHVYTDGTMTTIAQTRNSHHKVSDGGF